MKYDIFELLRENPYPGRGIIIGATEDGGKTAVAYFIMGRSVNSRNRVFESTEDGIRTKAFDESKMVDPSLIIYHPVREVGDELVVTNGDQTDTVRDFLQRGESFEAALRTREFEPDAPNFTSRISGMVNEKTGDYKLSILKAADGGKYCLRETFEYPAMPGVGHFIHTYKCDGSPIPAFEGEPEEIAITGSADEFGEKLWENLNPDNKVSLYVRFSDKVTGDVWERIFNKNG